MLEVYIQARVETIAHFLAWVLESRLCDSMVLCLEGERNSITNISILNAASQWSSSTILKKLVTHDLVRGVSDHTRASNDNLEICTFDGNGGQRYESGSNGE